MRIALISLFVNAAMTVSAQVCNPRDFQGVYGFQLSGTTTIAGDAKSVAGMGRLEFDGQGGISGTASVNFAGFLLGNPVTGSYQVASDCRITWSLQDDSGALQHFAGILSPDLQRGTFSQTDPGGAQRGTLAKAPAECSQARIQGTYDFTVSGNSVPMNPGEMARKISMQGVMAVDAAGNVARLSQGASTPAGTATVGSDCIVNLTLTTSSGSSLDFRGILTGREILAIESDPGTSVNARFRLR
jgi:hypothetical protein